MNRPILRMMLEGILTYIMTNPGLTHTQLVEKYNPILQPVCLTEILEVRRLQKLESVVCVACLSLGSANFLGTVIQYKHMKP